jgi:hypothetical protein
MAVLDIEPLDRHTFRGEADRGHRPGDAAGAVEPDGEFRTFEPRVGDAPLAPHQGAQRELDVQGAGADLAAVARAAELDPLQHEGGGGQQAGVDRAGDPELEPGQAARARLEFPAVGAPIDKIRPNQRCQQRQDDGNRKAEQRRLHAVSISGLLPRGLSHGAACSGPRGA